MFPFNPPSRSSFLLILSGVLLLTLPQMSIAETTSAPDLTRLANRMELGVEERPGETNRDDYDLIKGKEVLFESDSFSTSGEVSVWKHYDANANLVELRLINPDYTALIEPHENSGSYAIKELLLRNENQSEYQNAVENFSWMTPAKLYCRFGGTWLPATFKESVVVLEPREVDGGVQYLIKGPSLARSGEVLEQESNWVIVVDEENERLTSVYPIINGVTEVTSVEYQDWASNGDHSEPLTVMHGLVSTGNPGRLTDDRMRRTGPTKLRFDATKQLAPEEAYLSFYDLPEPSRGNRLTSMLWLVGAGIVIIAIAVFVRQRQGVRS